jgi:hypothetical protein
MLQLRSQIDRVVAEEGLAAAASRFMVAGILYTYRCTIACRHCGLGCGPEAPQGHTGTAQMLRHLRILHGIGRVVHVAGGEAMMFWDDLKDALAAAHAEGLQPHFVETNCSFAGSDAIVIERLEFLKGCGVPGILLSADPYHQEFVAPERFLRVRRLAREILGQPNVWCSGADDDAVRGYAAVTADERRLREHVRAHPPVMYAQAYRSLGRFLDRVSLDALPVDHIGGPLRCGPRDCRPYFDAASVWEIHIDPFDRIVTNCGVTLGKAGEVDLAGLMRRGLQHANELTEILARGGPFALAEMARDRHGYVIPDGAISKCALCYEVRNFLRPFYPELLVPEVVYEIP